MAAGWMVSVAVTSAAYLAAVGTGLFPRGPQAVLGVAGAVAVGFFVGGLFVGLRWNDAPILHAAAFTFLSVLIWFLGSLALPGALDAWAGPTPAVLGLVLVQFFSAAWGGWIGRRITLGGGVDLD
jgi:hypothetical protein